jgi:hypothetical protein
VLPGNQPAFGDLFRGVILNYITISHVKFFFGFLCPPTQIRLQWT